MAPPEAVSLLMPCQACRIRPRGPRMRQHLVLHMASRSQLLILQMARQVSKEPCVKCCDEFRLEGEN